MNWYDGRMASLDFESTGVDTENDRAVTACFVQVGGGEPTVKSDWLINPGVPIDPGASLVHGVTDEMAAKGQPAPSAIGEIAFAVRRTIRQGLPIIAYNAPFDLTLLDRECRRHHVVTPDWSLAWIIDPFVIWKGTDRFRRGSRNLAAACECFGVELGDDAHDSGADALAAARVAWKMFHKTDLVQGRHPEIVQARSFWKGVRESLPALQDVQRQWSNDQAASLRMYFEGKGEHEKAATVRQGWPWIPYVEQEVEA